MCKHTPATCGCGNEPVARTPKIRGFYRYGCFACGRSGASCETQELAIADWNRQTAAPDLLKALKQYVLWHTTDDDKLSDAGFETTDVFSDCLVLGEAAIDRAEPKP